MVKGWLISIALFLLLLLMGTAACRPSASQDTGTTQLVEVKRGNLTVTVSGNGNIEFTKETKLTFGVGGKVDRIYIKDGDKVKQGETLAKLETNVLELFLGKARLERNKAQVSVSQAQLSVTQAQIARQTAQYELNKANNIYKWPALEVAQADVEKAKLSLQNAQKRLEEAPASEKETWARLVAQAQGNLILYEDKLNAMLSTADTEEVALKKKQLEATEQSLKLAEQSLELAQQSLELATQSLEYTQRQFKEATITAPFDGTVASIYVKEGNIIPSPDIAPKTILHLIDPSVMTLKIQVDELDIPEVKPGQRVIIEVDALPALPLEGKVSSINLLPTVEAGVIVYDVKIDFALPEGVGLRAGMSAGTNIIINERSNVLLVPNRAINQDNQGNPVVEVMINGQIKPKAVVTGISDGLETEIIAGLKEGEMVLEKQAKPQKEGFLLRSGREK